MTLMLYDTLTRTKRPFEPRPGEGPITLYVCGPTVYNYAHIGNARPAVVFDVLFRLLRRLYGEDKVRYARNFTDVDDKINAAAIAEAGASGGDVDAARAAITDRFARIYEADMAALGCLPPTDQPRATAYMSEMVALIETLIQRGAAYATDDGEVLFDVNAYDAGSGRYGALSGRALEDMIAGARVEVAANKKNAADFVLWKPSKAGEPSWEGPRGLRGRPGWHIECSAMSEAVLGLPIDIHGGGHDLIFPHHTNEIAQSCAAHGSGEPSDYARYWMHNGFLDFSGEKMSKSLGNVVLVHDLVKTYPGEVIRWALLSGHYRSPLDWTPELLSQHEWSIKKPYQALRSAKALLGELPSGGVADERVVSALGDDLNTPRALRDLFAWHGTLNRAVDAGDLAAVKVAARALRATGGLLGFFQSDPDAWFEGGASDELKTEVEALIAERFKARQDKNWAEADRIRDRLTALNVVVMDNPTGATWRLKE